MTTKICSKCKEEKELCDFTKDKRRPDGVTCVCLICRNKTRRDLEKTNPEKYKQVRKEYITRKKEEISKQRKWYYENNKNKFQESQKRRRKETPEKFNYYWKSEEHRRKRIEQSCKNIRKKLDTDGWFRMIKNLRTRLRNYLKQKSYKKEKGFFDIVGIDPQGLKQHIENLFTEGMSWEKMGREIHIDHIIPLSKAQTIEELHKLNHYTNLQPLWAKENMKKSNKLYEIKEDSNN